LTLGLGILADLVLDRHSGLPNRTPRLSDARRLKILRVDPVE